MEPSKLLHESATNSRKLTLSTASPRSWRGGHEKEALALAAQQTSAAVKVRILLGVILGKMKTKLPK